MAQKAENKLRVFTDADDLLDNVDNDVILKWVNAYAKQVEYRKDHQKVYQAQKRLLLKYAKEQLAPDELLRITQLATEEADNATQAQAAEDTES